MKNYGSLADNILKKISFSPDIAVVMGSGLANISSYLEGPKSISYESLPGYPQTTIHGHSGKFVFGKYMTPLNGNTGITLGKDFIIVI